MTLKVYCHNCQSKQDASFRPAIDSETKIEYEDLCCDKCHSVQACIEGRTTPHPATTQAKVDLRKEFEQASRPLIKFLNDHYHPHAHVLVDGTRAELVTGTLAFQTEEYLKD